MTPLFSRPLGTHLATGLAVALMTLGALARPASAEFTAAYLAAGVGARATGMGSAVAAIEAGPHATYWNPAGLAALRGRTFSAGYQPLSLDRTLASLAAAANLRGGLGFGLVWIHAGVDGLVGRTNSGDVFGDLEDSENAVLFGLGLSPAPGLRLGGAFKVLRQSIDVAQLGESTATGRGLDLGLQYDLGAHTRLALTARNLMGSLKWTVARASSQTGTSEDDLDSELVAGAAHEPVQGLWLAADVHLGGIAPQGALGATWRVSPLLTARVGLSGVGEADGIGALAAGLSVRPMRSEALQIHYAYVQDPLDAGSRVSMGLSTLF